MRHFICRGGWPLAPSVGARRVLMAPGAALLIAPAGLTLAAQAGDGGAPGGAIALAPITSAAHEDLAVAPCA